MENFHHLHDGNFIRCHLHWNLREHFRKCWHNFIFPFIPNHNPTLNLPHVYSNHILIWTFSFQAHVWLKTINKLGLASLKTEKPGGLFGFTKLCWQPQFMKECCRVCKSLLSRYSPRQSRKEYRSDMFMGGCTLASGYLLKILWRLLSPSITIYTAASLNSFQNAIASASTCRSNLAFPEVNEKESRFPTALLLGIGAGKTDRAGTEEQLWAETVRSERTRTSVIGSNWQDNILAEETPLGEAAVQGVFLMLSMNRIKM